jgi:hypothetical protein
MDRFALGVGLLLGSGLGCGGHLTADTVPDASSTTRSEAGATQSEAGATCIIQVSNYDQSCTNNSDCVTFAGSYPVMSGDYCQPQCRCGGEAINRAAAAAFAADVAKTPAGKGDLGSGVCPCPALGNGGCCVQGRCTEVPHCEHACTFAAGAWTCGSIRKAQCPAGAANGSSCDGTVTGCFDCSEGAGTDCACQNGIWACIGSGEACSGG